MAAMMMDEEKSAVFRQRLRDIVKNLDMLQVDLARKSGLHARTINRWLRDQEKSIPKMDTLIKLSEALGVTVNYLLGEDSMEESSAKIATVAAFRESNTVNVEDFAKLRLKAKSITNLDDDDLTAAESMTRATLKELEREKAMRAVRKGEAE
jgi:DNA-binding XRE family transcriptional regulator